MNPSEALLSWNKAIQHATSAAEYLRKAPEERARGSNSNASCVESLLELAELNLRSALTEIEKLRDKPIR